MKFLQKDIDKFKKMSDKRKCKKDSCTEKRRKAWNRGKETKMPVTVTEGLAATDKVRFITNKHGLRNTLMEKDCIIEGNIVTVVIVFLMLKAVMVNLIAIVNILKKLSKIIKK